MPTDQDRNGYGQPSRLGRALLRLGVMTTIAVVALTVLLTYSLVQIATTQDKQNQFAAKTCLIQKRGLKAESQLIRFFQDYSKLLRLEAVKTEKQLRREPVRIRRLTRGAIAAIDRYAEITAAQPKHRSCP